MNFGENVLVIKQNNVGYRDTRIQGYKDTRIQGCRVTGKMKLAETDGN